MKITIGNLARALLVQVFLLMGQFGCYGQDTLYVSNSTINTPQPKGEWEAAKINYVPKPVSDGHVGFWDKKNKIEFVAMVTTATADSVNTCHFLHEGVLHEVNLTQSCAANVAITAGFDAAAVFGAWLLHRSHHHKLERLPMLYMAAINAEGFIYSVHNEHDLK